MPSYTLQDPDTGRTVTVSGDAPPNADEANAIFAAVKTPAAPRSSGPDGLAADSGLPAAAGPDPRGLSGVARPALETAGMIGGGLLGAAGGPVTAAAGGALGFAGGKAASDLLDRGLGVKAPIASLPQAAAETADNVVTGGANEAMGLGAGKVLEGAAALAPTVAKKAVTAVLGPSGEALDALFDRNTAVRGAKPIAVLAQELPQAAEALAQRVRGLRGQALDLLPVIKNAKPLDALAQELPGSVNELSKTVSDLSTQALGTLSRSSKVAEGAIPTDTLERAIVAQKEALGDGVSNATARANRTLDDYLARLSKLPDTLSQHDVGQFIRDFDHDIDWGKPELAPQNHALQGLRTTIDAHLKELNSDYEAAMAPTADATDLLVKARQLFGLKNDVGHGLVAGNNTATALKSALDANRLDSQGVLAGLEKYTGRDYLGDTKNAVTSEMFRRGDLSPEVDAALRQGNPAYKAAMAAVDEGQRLLDKARQIFNLQHDAAGKLTYGEHTPAALKTAVGEGRPVSQDVLDFLKKLTGRDFQQEAQDALTAEKFVGGKANGSRRVAAGAALGYKLGGVSGAAAGGVLGMHLDNQGHEIAGSLVDQLVRLSKNLPRGRVPSPAFQQMLAAALARSR